ncbi:MAG TPA: hypothetical protein PKE47_06070 [Verrucomicrobiota bacterium]|nr:hypothetical protein [Verrucomicrobiota bacterium]
MLKATELKRCLRRPPFRPFTIRVSSGAQYRVDEPGRVGGNEKVRHWFAEDDPGEWAGIDVGSITEIVSG